LANASASATYLTKAVDASLKRLRTDHIDLYYVHYDDKVTPLDETLGLFDKLIKSGKLGAIGASNYSPERLTTAMEAALSKKLAPYCVLQTHYNLVERRDFEKNLRPVCDKHGLLVMAYFALAKGFLSGKYRSKDDARKSAARGGGATAYLNEGGLRVLAALDEIAAARKANCASVALAWLIAKPRVHAIASATGAAQLDDLAAAMALKLTAAEVAALDAASG
jgi:aryl-alcohol dehydrogenase-like predicted oxidoreductase